MNTQTIKVALIGLMLTFSAYSNAGLIGVFGNNSNNNIVNFLNANGHTAVNFGGSATAAQLEGLDAVIGLRADGNNDVLNFVLNGGLYITEWRAAEWALDVANMLNADGGNNISFGSNTNITQSDLALSMGLGNGLSNPYRDGQRTQFQWTLQNIGAEVDILATREGAIPAILGGAVGNGYAFINTLDWADSFGSGAHSSGTWLLNALSADVNDIPEPSTIAMFGLALLGLASRKSKRV